MLKDRAEKNGKDSPQNQNDETETDSHPVGFGEGVSGDIGALSAKHDLNNAEEQKGTFTNTGKKQPSGRLKRIFLFACVALVMLLASVGIYLLVLYNQIQEPQRVLLKDGPENGTSIEENVLNDVYAAFPEHIVNLGLLGFDRGWDRENRGQYLFRPDVLAVISIDFDRDQISVVRIPRDSYVPIHGSQGFHDKINHAYRYGYYYGDGEDHNADGIRYTLLTMSNLLGGIPIHYYISVDMYSVIMLVDAFGGIYYDVEEEIVDKVWEYGVVLPPIPAGPQILDGKNFLRYLQYRDEKSGQDFGRIERQTRLLRETYQLLREENRIADIPVIYRAYRDYVDTDLSYKQIAALANYARNINLTAEKLQFYVLKGNSQTKDGVWYKIVSQEQRLEIIEKVFGIKVDPWPPIVLADSPEFLEEQERLR
ncbi:MAG TPA: LCP family protein, partial [Candidatus Limnocylindrales bacterium]|nr:LCP family protein [Candidatus Limnocylindrales bacterium]